MDRSQRFLLAIPVVSVVAFLLIGAAWFGYWIGEDARSGEPASLPVCQSMSDEARPRLLPQDEIVRCTSRLEPCDAMGDVCDVSDGWDDAASLDPSDRSDPPVDPADSPEEPPLQHDCESAESGAGVGASPSLPSDAEVADDDVHQPGSTPAAASEPASSTTAGDAARPTTPVDASEGVIATPWATPYRPGARSPQLEQTARQADYHTRYGFDLASRKAYHSARAEFVQALRIVAQGLDSEHACHVHSRALSAGLTALDEADDFVPAGSRLEGNLDLDSIIIGHATPVLKLAARDGLTPLESVRRYVDYAREQLAAAAGGEVAGSMALHALGKLHWSLADGQRAGRPIDDTKAVAFFQAAAEVCPENYLALNDLGVLLARGGRYGSARRALVASLAIVQDPTVQMNLAGVCRRLGDVLRAQQIEREAAALWAAGGKPQGDPARPAPSVVWLPPQEFVGSYAAAAGPWQPARVAPEAGKAAPPAAAPAPVKQASRAWSWDWFLKTRK